MQLEPYQPGKLVPSRRNASLVAAGVTALGALTVGALAVGSALARLARPRVPEADEPATLQVVPDAGPATPHAQRAAPLRSPASRPRVAGLFDLDELAPRVGAGGSRTRRPAQRPAAAPAS